MLVLGRRFGESICIGKGVEVIPVKRNGNQIVLGIIAPPDVMVYRKELQMTEEVQEKLPMQDTSLVTCGIPSRCNVLSKQCEMLRFSDLKPKLNYSRRTLTRRIAKRLWTKPVRLSDNTIGWPVYEVEMLIAAYIAGRSDHNIRQLVEIFEAARQKLIQ